MTKFNLLNIAAVAAITLSSVTAFAAADNEKKAEEPNTEMTHKTEEVTTVTTEKKAEVK